MNVEYKCPICGSRGFFEPNKPIYKCHVHTDTIMEQTEDYKGPNFEFKDEGDRDPKKTGVLTVGADAEAISIVRATSTPTDLSDEAMLKHLRQQYERVAQTPPDGRWGIQTLKSKIEGFEHDLGVQLEPHEEEELDNQAEEVPVNG